jgi:hypothetical protein
MKTAASLPIAEDKTQARPYPTHGGRRDRTRYYANSRAHIFLQSEGIMDNLVNRQSRPVSAFRAVLLELHPELEGRIRWSQKAGCSCGCSPGFIIDHTVRNDKNLPSDIYITIGHPKVPEPVVDMSYVEMALA